ncbi:hypothetical protein O3P69_008383 [Scylla paramamosain]|uniref:C2H2-type domain-containing protein n=1 Tax=Scylla paramamosain TaxID=85552 RepID=A0AAW0SKP5_SCYPA
MYAGVVNVSQSDLPQLIKAAEMLEIKGLAVADDPPSDSKRPAQTRDTPVDHSSPNPKRPRQDEKRLSNRAETLNVNSPAPPQSSPLRKDDNLDEQTNAHNVYEKVNQKQTQSELRQDRKDSSCNRSEQLDSKHGLDHLTLPRGNENEVASGSVIKEEKIELENEKETADIGYEYDCLMTDLIGDGGGDTKEHGASMEPFNHSLNEESFSAEAGPSGLQVWPALGEGVESASQGYTGGLPIGNHPGQQPLQMEHMVGSESECRWVARGMAQGPAFSFSSRSSKKHHLRKVHQCPFCSYATGFHHNLTKHVRTHTGEKPYVCTRCPFRANQNSSLKRHMHKIHNEACGQDRIQVRVQVVPQV